MHPSLPYLIFSTCLLFVIAAGCDNSTSPGLGETDFSTVPDLPDTTNAAKVTEGELFYYVIKEGGGNAKVQNRDEVAAYYTLRRQDGTILTSTYVNGLTTPQDITVAGFSTEGIRIGINGMKVNERRVVVVPPSLGYGNVPETSPNYDLRNDTLYYDIEINRIYTFESS